MAPPQDLIVDNVVVDASKVAREAGVQFCSDSGFLPAMGGFTLRNPNTDWVATDVTYAVQYRGAGGSTWEVSYFSLADVWPGQETASDVLDGCPFGTQSATPWKSAEVAIHSVSWVPLSRQKMAPPTFTTWVDLFERDPYLSDRFYVMGEVTKLTPKGSVCARVVAALFDAQGTAVGYNSDFGLKLRAGKPVRFDTSTFVIGPAVRADVFVETLPKVSCKRISFSN